MLLQRPYLTKGDVENEKREMNNDVSLAAYPATAFIREIYCSLSGQLTVETYMVKSESSIVQPQIRNMTIKDSSTKVPGIRKLENAKMLRYIEME
jgi:hypothetical protein